MINKLKTENCKLKIPVKRAGFTILESIIAIMVLSLSISGVFSSVQQSLSQATFAKDEVKAFYLAQEAIEVIRNKRDNNQLIKMNNNPSYSWLEGITQGTPSCPFNRICTFDATDFSEIVDCGTTWGSCTQNLREDPVSHLYGYDSSWVATGFKREIQIESVSAYEIMVTVKISWSGKEFKVKTHLFNWI